MSFQPGAFKISNCDTRKRPKNMLQATTTSQKDARTIIRTGKLVNIYSRFVPCQMGFQVIS